MKPAIIFILAISLLASCSEIYRKCHGVTWNTTYNITYKSSLNLDDSIQSVMRQVDLSLSPFNPSSTISLINRGEDVAIDSLITRVFIESQRINSISDGLFDPTVSPIINLWGFGYDDSIGTPTRNQLDSVLQFVGIDQCHISNGHIIKKHSSTEFNFSSITKGYGCDLIAGMLKRNGCHDFLIEIGGEISACGTSPRNGTWRVMIDAPNLSTDTIVHERLAVIDLNSPCGMATSGNYRNYRIIDNRHIGHTMSPTTGMPINSEILSATIIAPSAMTADALATACMAMPIDKAFKMIERESRTSALFVINDSAGNWTLLKTSGFPTIQ